MPLRCTRKYRYWSIRLARRCITLRSGALFRVVDVDIFSKSTERIEGRQKHASEIDVDIEYFIVRHVVAKARKRSAFCDRTLHEQYIGRRECCESSGIRLVCHDERPKCDVGFKRSHMLARGAARFGRKERI